MLKLQEGHYYENTDGIIIGPIKRYLAERNRFYCEGRSYDISGQALRGTESNLVKDMTANHHYVNTAGTLTDPNDSVSNPSHYNSHPSGIECIAITRHMDFCMGNAMKYIWRAGLKGDSEKQDIKKAIWYLNDKLKQLNKEE